MAEEDLIFGKNRHMFGGIEPSNMQGFSVFSKTGAVKLLARLPKDTVIDGQTLCTVAGAIIRRRTDKPPVDEFDGDLVANITTSGQVTDTTADLSKNYYYSAFPYTTQGVYNRNPVNRTKYTPTGSYYLYGYDLDTTNPDPDARVTYPSDVENELFEPAKMNFTDDTFSYGSWPSTPGEGFMPRPCMLNKYNVVAYYLNQNDYTKRSDGAPSNYDGTLTGDSGYNAMMEWPKIYTKRELVNGIYKFRCSSAKIDDSWECWCNYNQNNVEIDHFYTSIYKRGVHTADGTQKLRSLGGNEHSAYINENCTELMSLARANGSNWNIEVLSDHLLIQDLLVMMAKTTDLKSAYGDGWDATSSKSPGGLETKGLFYCSPPAAGNYGRQTGRVKVFGMVDYWDSNLRRRLAGWINVKGVQKVKITEGTKDGSTATYYNYTGDGYLTIPDAYAGAGGYISACRVEPYGRIPIGYNGSETTYECDYLTTGNQVTGFAVLAGTLYSNERGPFGVELDTEPGFTSNSIGASISYKPAR